MKRVGLSVNLKNWTKICDLEQVGVTAVFIHITDHLCILTRFLSTYFLAAFLYGFKYKVLHLIGTHNSNFSQKLVSETIKFISHLYMF